MTTSTVWRIFGAATHQAGRGLSLAAALFLGLGGPVQALSTEAALLQDAADVLEEAAEVLSVTNDLVAATARGFGNDGERIVDFMSTGIAYVPYSGVLKGAEGTLRSGAGNSYDQALTLATLLREAGYEAQLLVGLQPATDASPSTSREGLPIHADAEVVEELTVELEDITAELAALSGTTLQASPILPQQDAGTLAQQVLAVLPESTLSPAIEDHSLWAITRFRVSPAQDWTYADPARATQLEGVDVASLDILSDTIPQDHQHRVSFTLRVESETFGSVAAGQFSAATVNLNDAPLGITLMPFGAGETLSFVPNQRLAIVSDALGSFGVTREGQVFPVEAGAFASVFETGAGLMADAMTTLQSDGARMEAAPLDRIVLQVTTTGPSDTPTQSASRTLLDRGMVEEILTASGGSFGDYTGADAHASATLAAAYGTYTFFAGAAPANDLQVAAASIDTLSSAFRDFAALEEGETTGTSEDSLDRMLQQQIGGLFAGFQDVPHHRASVAMIRTLSVPDAVGGTAQLAVATDIMLDGRRSADRAAHLTAMLSAAAQEAALVDRVAQSVGLSDTQSGSFAHLSTALEASVEPLDGATYLAALPEPETVAEAQHRDHISTALESGHTITIWPMGDVQDTVWVEVDPVAGTYRLASGTGAGNAANETVTLIGLIAGTLMTVLTMNDCSGRGSPAAVQACRTCNAAAFSGATAAGASAGMAAGLAGSVAGPLAIAAAAMAAIVAAQFAYFQSKC